MKKVFCILSILTISLPALAETNNNDKIATGGYVKGAVNALTSEYNATSNPSGRLIISGSGDRISNVSVANGKITYTKTYEATVPVSSNNSSTRANIWIE